MGIILLIGKQYCISEERKMSRIAYPIAKLHRDMEFWLGM